MILKKGQIRYQGDKLMKAKKMSLQLNKMPH